MDELLSYQTGEYHFNGCLGLNVDLNPVMRLKSGGDIDYLSGNRLVYREGENGFIFDYYSSDRRIRLNDLVYDDHWKIVPVESQFQVQLTYKNRYLDNPELQLSIKKTSVPGLEDDEMALFVALHEIGHANHFSSLYESLTKKDDNKDKYGNFIKSEAERLGIFLKFDGDYTKRLCQTRDILLQIYSMNNSLLSDHVERMAWTLALKNVRQQRILTQFDLSDFKSFYHAVLQNRKPRQVSGCVAVSEGKKSKNLIEYWNQRTDKRSWKKD